jgi:molybdate transport system substrate-binding protein
MSHDARRHARRAVTALLAALPLGLHRRAAAQPAGEITVFAAASLQNALEDIARVWRQSNASAPPLRFSFAASSNLARQIAQGAPAAIFASADEQWMDYLQQRKLMVDDTRKSLLGNRLALVVPASSRASVDLKPGFDLAALLGADGRWVTGDPASVPVGRYAQQAMTHLGVWPLAQTRLVRAENVRVALAFVERGEVAAGVVYETDATASTKVRIAAVFPADSHAPIRYPIAIVGRHDTPAARAFLSYLSGPAAREVWRKHGFALR